MAKFDESKHPRGGDGKFTNKNGQSSEWDNMSAAEMSATLQQEIQEEYNNLTNTRKPVKIVMLPNDLYAEFDSVIRTRYGNKIPRDGYVMLHNPIKGYNFFMLFYHDEHSDRNVCTCKLDLDRDIDLINNYIERFN